MEREIKGWHVFTGFAAAFEIRRMVLGLDTIRILGRVESRRDHVFEAACSATLDQIDSVQAEISESLQSLSNLAVAIQTSLTLINTSRRSREAAMEGAMSAAQESSALDASFDDAPESSFMSDFSDGTDIAAE